ncbi:MAG: hypothetical protein ACYTGL_29265, partial [Planctomycetota bacterium]
SIPVLPTVLCRVLFSCLLIKATSLNAADDPRVVWEYSGAYGKSWLAHEGGTKWMAWLGNSTSLIHVEEGRTADFIQLRAIKTGIQLRLYPGGGQIKKVDGPQWKRWTAVGNWVGRDRLPKAAVSFPDYQIRVVYFVPSDREPITNYDAKIRVVLSYVEELFRSSPSLRRENIEQLPFERDGDQIQVHLVKANEPASFFNENWEKHDGTQLRRILKYLRENEFDPSRRVTLVIPETWEDAPAEEGWPGHCAFGTNMTPDGGMAVYSGWILQDQFCATTVEAQRDLFFDKTPVPGRRSYTVKTPNSPVFEFVENGIGGVAHELGHALGLPHNYNGSNRNIMANGFRKIQSNFDPQTPPSEYVGFSADNARLLMSSRYLAKRLKLDDYDPPAVQASITKTRKPGELLVAFNAMDNTRLRSGVIVRQDKEGFILASMPLRGRKQVVRKIVSGGVTDATKEFVIFVTDDGGNITKARIPVEQIAE